MISFAVTHSDSMLISKIVERAVNEGWSGQSLSLEMDLTACHANESPLDLHGLLTSRDVDFSHDIYGISHHMDRQTGTLRDHFVPRYSRNSETLMGGVE